MNPALAAVAKSINAVVRSETKKDFDIGHWYVSTGPGCVETVVNGPFTDKLSAIDFAMDLTGAEYFVEDVKE